MSRLNQIATTEQPDNQNQFGKITSTDEIGRRILIIRDQHVLLSQQLAELYKMEVRVFNQKVKRNPKFFPEGSFFQLSKKEFQSLESLIRTPYRGGIHRARPYAFTLSAIISLQSLLSKHIPDKLDFNIVRAFTNKRKGLESELT